MSDETSGPDAEGCYDYTPAAFDESLEPDSTQLPTQWEDVPNPLGPGVTEKEPHEGFTPCNPNDDCVGGGTLKYFGMITYTVKNEWSRSSSSAPNQAEIDRIKDAIKNNLAAYLWDKIPDCSDNECSPCTTSKEGSAGAQIEIRAFLPLKNPPYPGFETQPDANNPNKFHTLVTVQIRCTNTVEFRKVCDCATDEDV